MKFSVDTNILVYAFDVSDAAKHELSNDVLEKAAQLDCVLPAQCFAEFLNVIRKKQPTYFVDAIEQTWRWASLFPVVDSRGEDVLHAAAFADRHRLQLFDSLIWQVAQNAGATLLLSEDFHDGLSIDGMTILNPFRSENRDALDLLLSDSGD